MHELSIARTLVSMIERESHEQHDSPALAVVTIGPLTGVEPGSLVWAFESAKKDSAAAHCSLEVRAIPFCYTCENCGHRWVEEQFVVICPACGWSSVRLEHGDELELQAIEFGTEEG